MDAPFDPYHKWLGISPKDQPPNHYRLLGIELYESDAEVIEAAANRQMAYLQEISLDGQAMDVAQRLLNEMAAARLCLLDPRRRAAYDAQLRGNVAAGGSIAQPPRSAPRPPPVTRVQPAAASAPRRSSLRWWGVCAASSLAMAVLIAAIYLAAERGGPAPKSRAREAAVVERPAAAARPDRVQCAIIIDWPHEQREGATLEINHRPRRIPGSKVFRVAVKPGNNSLRIQRPGYVTIRWSHVFARGEHVPYSPAWEPVAKEPRVATHGDERPLTGKRPAAAAAAPPKRGRGPVAGKGQGEPAAADRKRSPRSAPLPELPARFALPKRGDATPDAPRCLWRCPADRRLQLALVGGEVVLPGAESLRLIAGDSAGTRYRGLWVVRHERGGGPSVVVGRFALSARGLEFWWVDDRREAEQLRNCLLRISAGKQSRLVRLRAPVAIEPLVIRGPRFSDRTPLSLTAVPAGRPLICELARIEAPPPWQSSFPVRQAAVGEVLRAHLKLPDNRWPLELRTEFASRDISEGRLRLEVRAAYQHPREGTKAMGIKAGQELPQLAAWAVAARGPADKDRTAAEFELYRHYIRQLALFVDHQRRQEIRLHLRVYFTLGDHRVDLAVPRPPVKPPPAGQKP